MENVMNPWGGIQAVGMRSYPLQNLELPMATVKLLTWLVGLNKLKVQPDLISHVIDWRSLAASVCI